MQRSKGCSGRTRATRLAKPGVPAGKLVAGGAENDGEERAEQPWRARLKQIDVCFQVFVCTLYLEPFCWKACRRCQNAQVIQREDQRRRVGT